MFWLEMAILGRIFPFEILAIGNGWKWDIPIHFQTQPRLGRFEVFHRRPSHCLASCLKLFSSQLLWLHDQISPQVQVAVASMSQLLCKLPNRLAIFDPARDPRPRFTPISWQDRLCCRVTGVANEERSRNSHALGSQSASCKAVEQLYNILHKKTGEVFICIHEERVFSIYYSILFHYNSIIFHIIPLLLYSIIIPLYI